MLSAECRYAECRYAECRGVIRPNEKNIRNEQLNTLELSQLICAKLSKTKFVMNGYQNEHHWHEFLQIYLSPRPIGGSTCLGYYYSPFIDTYWRLYWSPVKPSVM